MYEQQINAYFDAPARRAQLVEAISRLVRIRSVREEPQPGMPFGPGPAAVRPGAVGTRLSPVFSRLSPVGTRLSPVFSCPGPVGKRPDAGRATHERGRFDFFQTLFCSTREMP